MSKLVLTKFIKKPDTTKYQPYELSCKPETNEMVFIYQKYGEGKENENDKANQHIIKKAFGWMKLDKIQQMTSTQVKSMTGNKNGSSFVQSRADALKKMYDDLADKFLTYLHQATWSVYDKDTNHYVLSTIDYEEAYKDIFMAIESLEIVLTKIINDKFNEKYSNYEVENALKEKKLEIEQTINRIKK